MSNEIRELTVEEVYKKCDPSIFDFETTKEVSPLDKLIGQKRALRAIDFGLKIKRHGYNLYLSGLPGTGKTSYIRSYLKEIAKEEETPSDWLYVYNFKQPSKPRAISLPPGKGEEFCHDMEEFIEELRTELPKVFSSEEYEKRKVAIMKALQEKSNKIMETLNEEAKREGLAIVRTNAGYVTIPIVNGKQITPEEFETLSEDVKREIEEKTKKIQDRLFEALRQIRNEEREAKKEIAELDKQTALFVVKPRIEELLEKYKGSEKIEEYLKSVQDDIINNLGPFIQQEEETSPLNILLKGKSSPFTRYKVNLIVNRKGSKGAPVVEETHPTYPNLIGKIEYEGQFGTMVTDFTKIRAGAFHRANGGYLILQVKDLLSNLGSWDALKRVLKDESIKIESLSEKLGLATVDSLKPEPIPVKVKVVLVGNPILYHLLYQYDEDFSKLFKIKADFDWVMKRDNENILKLASFVSSYCEREGLIHFDRSGMARLVEYSSRISDNQEKLSAMFNKLTELIQESATWAQIEGADVVSARHVDRAVEEKIYRSNLYEEKLQEMIDKGKILIDIDGEKVGQINGLAVLSLGDYSFAKPSKITANVFLGKEGVVNIEREVKMSGTIHSKGVLILSGFLREKFSQKFPPSFSASLTFEQVYEGVDGDSASSTELYALLSALSGIPIKQYIAVTGSINQKGEIQPIGGVNEKIEGFFKVCKSKGLTGKQGVIIPIQNVDNLMLNKEVQEAMEKGLFHIYPVSHVREGIKILTGMELGEPTQDGTYPEGTISYFVQKRLKEMFDTIKSSEKEEKKEGDSK